MLKRHWQWLKRLLQRWFATPARKSAGENSVVVPRKILTDTEYETLFLELLAGVNQAWSRGRVKGFLAAKCITEAELLAWLRRFREKLLASNAPNTELAARMVQLGELDIGKVGDVARDIGKQLLRRGEETNRRGAEGAEEEEGEASQSTPDEAEAWFKLGNQQYEAGDFLGAIASYDKALAINPDYYQAWGNRGNALNNLGRHEEAIASCDKALAINPNDYLAWLNRGAALNNLGRNEEAIASYDKALAIKPDFYLAWVNRGNALNNLGRHEEAIASCEKALAINPDFYLAWVNRGNALNNLGRHEEGIASYDKAITINPDFYLAWVNRGNALDDLGRYEEAIASYDKALAINPDFYEAWFNRGNALHHLGRHEEAIASFDKAIAINPDDYEAWDVRGNALHHLGRNEEAIASHDNAIAINPDFYQAWVNRGAALHELGRDEEAIASCDKAITINPDLYQAWYNRGAALHNLGRYEQAIASHDNAIAINPDFYQAWVNRGAALHELGRDEEAIASFDKALAINPDLYQAWSNRGLALHNLGRYEEAIASYDKAITINPDDYEAWGNRGVALNELGRHEEAIASHDNAIAINPDFYLAWVNRGNALDDLGRYEEAIASYDKALAIKADDYLAWGNRGVAAGNSVSCDPLLSYLSTIARQNPALNRRGYEGELASYEEGLKHCSQDTHPKGWGLLHQYIGNAHYFQRRRVSHPRPYCQKAVNSYNQALKTLTEADFPELHLEVLQDLIRAFLDLGYTGEAQELGRRGTDLLRRLHRECKSPGKKKQLALKFAGFQQLTVDLAVQSGNWCAALELAELDKNACICWLLDGWSDEISSPSYREIRQLLNPATAIVYWHLSPYALHTFILKHNASSPIVLSSPLPVGTQDFTPLLAAVQRLREFEDWVKDWNQQYNDYRKGKSPENPAPQAQRGDKEEKYWRDNLPAMLGNLGNILDIPAIVSEINRDTGRDVACNVSTIQNPKSKIQNIILVPHRDLHRFPLHALFPDEFTITYLPSAQMGLLNSSTNRDCVMLSEAKRNEASHPPITSPSLLSVEHPTSDKLPLLEFAQVESEAICQIFPNHKRIRSEQVTLEALQSALPQKYSIFHFSGHGTYNFHNPALSYLALAGEDKLTLADIYKQFNLTNQVNLKSYRLVSLAACETAITGNHTITTEYVGLASGFMACGVAHVLSTLWKVESAPSALVMIQFYQRLQQGKSEAVALAEATQWLRNVTNAELAEWYAAEIAKLPANELILRRFLSRHLDKLKKTAEPIQPYNDSYFWAAFTITGMPS